MVLNGYQGLSMVINDYQWIVNGYQWIFPLNISVFCVLFECEADNIKQGELGDCWLLAAIAVTCLRGWTCESCLVK